MNIFDVIVLIILIFALYSGFKRGLRSLFGSVTAFIIGGFFAYAFYKPVSALIEKKFDLIGVVTGYIRSNINPSFSKLPASVLKYKLVSFLNSLSLPESAKEFLGRIIKQIYLPSNQTIGQFLPNAIGKIALFSLSFILIFIVIYIITKILVRLLLKGEENSPTLKRVGAIGNFLLMFFIVFSLLSIYDSFGLSILIPNARIVKIINASLSLKIARLLRPLLSSIVNIII